MGLDLGQISWEINCKLLVASAATFDFLASQSYEKMLRASCIFQSLLCFGLSFPFLPPPFLAISQGLAFSSAMVRDSFFEIIQLFESVMAWFSRVCCGSCLFGLGLTGFSDVRGAVGSTGSMRQLVEVGFGG